MTSVNNQKYKPYGSSPVNILRYLLFHNALQGSKPCDLYPLGLFGVSEGNREERMINADTSLRIDKLFILQLMDKCKIIIMMMMKMMIMIHMMMVVILMIMIHMMMVVMIFGDNG